MTKQLLLYIGIISTLNSCVDRGTKYMENDKQNEFEDKIRFVLYKEHTLKLDSLTSNSFGSNSFQYSDTGFFDAKHPEVAFINGLTNSIYFYDLATGEAYKIIKLPLEGPEGVGQIDAMYFHNKDSIFLKQNDFSGFKVFLINSKAKIVDTIDLQPFSNSKTRKAKLGTTSFPTNFIDGNAPVISNGKVYFSGQMDDGWSENQEDIKESGTLIIYDLASKTKKYLFPYPDTYHNVLWPGNFRHVYHTYNTKKKNFIYSFPADHYVYEVSPEGEVLQKKYAGSKHAKGINSFQFSWKETFSFEKRMDHIYSNPSYNFILYDKYRDLYYRLGLLPIENTPSNDRSLQFSIIILDKNLDKVGEYLLEKKSIYNLGAFFISKEGLNLAIKASNENELTFKCLKASKITK